MIKVIAHTLFLLSYIFLYFLSNRLFVPGIVWGLPLLAFIGVNIWGASAITSNYHLKAICKNGRKNEILLTFDDGPHPEYTKKILTILEKHNIKALFFVIGKNIEGNESLLKELHEKGHVVGNHTFSHSYIFDIFLPKKVKAELEKTTLKIKNTIGKTPILFRPPYGVTNPFIAIAVKKLKLTTIGWNIRTLDTLKQNESEFMNRLEKLVQNGGIILLHDNREQTTAFLENLILYLKEKNFSFPTPEKYLETRVYE